MKSSILVVRLYADKLKSILGRRRVSRYLSSRSSVLPCLDDLKDGAYSSDELISSDDDIWHNIGYISAESFEGNECYAGDYSYDYSENKKPEDVEMKNIRTVLANCGWSIGRQSWHRIEMNEFNVIRVLDILFYESCEAALARYFFRWSERCNGMKHTIRSICTMVHIMVADSRNCRAVDLILYLIRSYGKEDGSYDLFLYIFYQTHRERKVLKCIYSMLVDCYVKEGMVSIAHNVARKMKQFNIFPSMGVCNKLIEGLLRLHQWDEAWDFLEEMQSRGIALNASIICLFIHDYCARSDIGRAWKLIGIMNSHEIKADVVSYSIIIHSLCKMSCLREATFVFFKMLQAGVTADSVLISSLVDGYCRVGDLQKAMNLLKIHNLPLNIYLYSSFITKLCRNNDMFRASVMFHGMTEVGFCPDCYIYTAMIWGYCRAGQMNRAKQYLGMMLKNGIKLSTATYTVLIGASCKLEDMGTARRLFHMMQTEGLKPDIFAYNTLVEGYGKQGLLSKVFELLSIMRSVNVPPDTVTYNILIHSLILGGFVHEAKNILDELMQRGFSPDKVTFTSVINGLSSKGKFKEAFLTWFQMSEKKVEPDLITCSALLSGYCKARRMEEANALFRMMLNAGLKPDLILFNSLIHGFCRTGNIDDACEMVRSMVQHGILPNNATYRALVLGFEKARVINPSESANLKLQKILRTYSINSDFGG